MVLYYEVIEYKYGEMDIIDYQKIFVGFVKVLIYMVIVVIVVLIFMVLINV